MRDIRLFDCQANDVTHYWATEVFNWVSGLGSTGYIGTLRNVKSCVVTMEINGVFELRMTLLPDNPMTGRTGFDSTNKRYGMYYKQVVPGNLIAVDIPRFSVSNQGELEKTYSTQFFRIAEVKRGLAEIQVQAYHISYELSWYQLVPWSGSYAFDYFIQHISNAVYPMICEEASGSGYTQSPFNILYEGQASDWADTRITYRGPASIRRYMGGMEGSIIDLYGGEWDFDNLYCTLRKQLGIDYGYQIAYGANMASYEHIASTDNVYNAVMVYCKMADGTEVWTPVKVSASQLPTGNDAVHRRWGVLDVSEDYAEETTPPTTSQLYAKGNAYLNKYNPHRVAVSLDAQYAFNPQSMYNRLTADDGQILQECVGLGDTVAVSNDMYDQTAVKLRVVRLEYDVLAGRNRKIELSQPKKTLSKTISDLQIATGDATAKVERNGGVVAMANAASTLMGGV